MKKTSLALALIYCLTVPLWGQNPQPTPSPTPTPAPEPRPDDDEVVRITTNLVQVDVTVTDSKGRHVNDLKPEDFEIYEDGKPQPLTNFSYVALTPNEKPAPTPKPDKNAPPVPPAPPTRLKAEQVQRTIALVVDDLGLSFESTYFAREALKKFVDKQMQPGDLVAIIRTSGGIGALQSFTSDKRQLYAAIERIKWYPSGRGGVGAFAPLGSDPALQQSGEEDSGDDNNRNINDDLEDFRSEIFAVGTLGALNYIVRGLRELPGRKSVLLISDGFSLATRDGEQSTRVLESLRRLTDLANRASVVIYTMDARGLVYTGLTAADNTGGFSADQIEQQLSNRRNQLFDTQAGLSYLAQQTGGFAIKNSNDLNGGFQRVLDDQTGYYLLGYRPDDATFDPVTGRRTFHKINVKVKRPGLKVRTRTGFYGVSEENAVPVRRTREAQMLGALTSPFGASGVRVRLTSFFANDAQSGSYLRALLYIDGHDLTFTKQPDGTHKATFDVLALTFGDNGVVVDSIYKNYTLTVTKDLEQVISDGLVYTVNVPLKKPGAYQLRVALRDAATEKVGAAGQFIEAPNLKKDRLALSGVVVNGVSSQAGVEDDPQAAPAVRRLRHGMFLDFGYMIYNAKLDKTTKQPQLTVQAKFFRDGREVFASRPRAYVVGPQQTDLKRLPCTGRLQLGRDLPPGAYILQVIVTDALANKKHSVATQWTDFEIAP